jgi:hypothetical protein
MRGGENLSEVLNKDYKEPILLTVSLPPPPDRFFTIYIKNAGYQSDPYIVSATKSSDFNLSIIN